MPRPKVVLCGVDGELKRRSSVECVHEATQTKLLQGLATPEVVDVLEVVGEQKVKVVLRSSVFCSGPTAALEANPPNCRFCLGCRFTSTKYSQRCPTRADGVRARGANHCFVAFAVKEQPPSQLCGRPPWTTPEPIKILYKLF